jgi:Leucine-rich repeat (LRR) protein
MSVTIANVVHGGIVARVNPSAIGLSPNKTKALVHVALPLERHDLRAWFSDRFENLRVLDISDNQLENVPVEIKSLKNLRNLQLHTNRLTMIPEGLFACFTVLTTLNLSHNQISDIPKDIQTHTNLQILDVSHNQLQRVFHLDQMKKLTHLLLNNNNISWFQLRNLHIDDRSILELQELYLNSNKLNNVPDQFINDLNHIQVLDLSDNDLITVPLRINKINKTLVKLMLNKNKIQALPWQLGELWNLTDLDISDNNIHEMPASFWTYDNLRCLNLSNNAFVSFAENFLENSYRLEHVNVMDCAKKRSRDVLKEHTAIYGTFLEQLKSTDTLEESESYLMENFQLRDSSDSSSRIYFALPDSRRPENKKAESLGTWMHVLKYRHESKLSAQMLNILKIFDIDKTHIADMKDLNTKYRARIMLVHPDRCPNTAPRMEWSTAFPTEKYPTNKAECTEISQKINGYKDVLQERLETYLRFN